jgi:hypothetical protein
MRSYIGEIFSNSATRRDMLVLDCSALYSWLFINESVVVHFALNLVDLLG